MVYHVWIDGNEEFKITAYHPVYVHEQGWITAINLREGDVIETIDGCAYITPLYNFINDTLVSESTVLRHLLRHLILYWFRLFP